MLFKNKRIKKDLERQKEAEAQKELERKRREEELELERQKHEQEAARIEAERLSANPVSKYKFSEPEPKPKELISVLKRMLQKTFPDAQKAYLLLTQYNEKSGYLLIVDIDAKFLKIINLYLDSETKPVRNSLPIECILYSKSGSLTEGIEPFYVKQTSESEKIRAKAAAVKAEAGIDNDKVNTDITLDDMPELDIKDKLFAEDGFSTNNQNNSETSAENSEEEKKTDEPAVEESVVEEPVVEEPVVEEPVAEEPVVEEPVVEEPVVEEPVAEESVVEEPVLEEPVAEEPVVEEPVAEEPVVEEPVVEEPVAEESVVEEPVAEEPVVVEPVVEETVVEEPVAEEPVVVEPVVEETVVEESTVKDTSAEKPIKIIPTNKAEFFAILNKYGISPGDASFAVANAALKEFRFYVPYTVADSEPSGKISDSFPTGKEIMLGVLINVKTKSRSIPFFTEKSDAEEFAQKRNCDLVYLKYKSFKKAHHKEVIKLDSFDGIVINPNGENVFLPCDYPLL